MVPGTIGVFAHVHVAVENDFYLGFLKKYCKAFFYRQSRLWQNPSAALLLTLCAQIVPLPGNQASASQTGVGAALRLLPHQWNSTATTIRVAQAVMVPSKPKLVL